MFQHMMILIRNMGRNVASQLQAGPLFNYIISNVLYFLSLFSFIVYIQYYGHKEHFCCGLY